MTGRSFGWSISPTAGKRPAINNGVNHADPEASVVVTLDADTLFHTDTLRKLVRHFADPKVGAVAGHVKVGNRRNVLTAWQSLEYLNGICVIRMAEMMIGAVGIVPGACSAWRRSALEEIGGFCEDTLAEDADAAMKFQRLRYRVLHDNHALCDTEAPETIVPLLKQRKRWMFGNFQVLWKNRTMLLRPRYGMLGMVTMPFSVVQLGLNFVFMPILAVAGVYALSHGDWQPVAVGAAIIFAIHLVSALAALAIARESYWHLLVLPLYRPMYELMRVYLLYACAYRVAKGAEFAWDKLERRNSVVRKDAHERVAEGQPELLVPGGGYRAFLVSSGPAERVRVSEGRRHRPRQADVLRLARQRPAQQREDRQPDPPPRGRGAGTYDDPTTVAVKGPWAPGTRMYLPYLSRYLIVEDLCASCTNDWIDVWAGGVSKPKSSVLPCQDALYHRGPRDPSGRVEVEIDPPSWYPVVNAGSLC